jgi:hypothetical protein
MRTSPVPATTRHRRRSEEGQFSGGRCIHEVSPPLVPGAAACEAAPRLSGSIPSHPLHPGRQWGEFDKALTELLTKQNIRHVRLGPRRPHLNGRVETVQRTVQEEHCDGMTEVCGGKTPSVFGASTRRAVLASVEAPCPRGGATLRARVRGWVRTKGTADILPPHSCASVVTSILLRSSLRAGIREVWQ